MGNVSKFFEENQTLFSSALGTDAEKEKYNLYGGLMALSKKVEDIENLLEETYAKLAELIKRNR